MQMKVTRSTSTRYVCLCVMYGAFARVEEVRSIVIKGLHLQESPTIYISHGAVIYACILPPTRLPNSSNGFKLLTMTRKTLRRMIDDLLYKMFLDIGH